MELSDERSRERKTNIACMKQSRAIATLDATLTMNSEDIKPDETH